MVKDIENSGKAKIRIITMPLGIGRLAVLESKLDIYEDLSKEMLDKLEKAVATISDNSNKVAIILERHENRLNESDKNDAIIIKMLDEVKLSNTLEHKAVIERIEKIENKVSDLYKFRWQIGGVLAVVIFVLPLMNVHIPKLLTQAPAAVSIERGK